MAKPKPFHLLTTGMEQKFSAGERVSLPVNEAGHGLEVISDPRGKYVVISCDRPFVEVQRITNSHPRLRRRASHI